MTFYQDGISLSARVSEEAAKAAVGGSGDCVK